MALHAGPLDLTPEFPEVSRNGDAGFSCLFPVPYRDVEREGFIPGDKGVPHQARDVVRNRSEESVLEVENAGHRIRHHQVSRHEVAVHDDLRLSNARGEQVADLIPDLFLFGIERRAAVMLHVPLGEEGQFGADLFFGIIRQNTRLADGLKRNKRRGRRVKILRSE